MIKLLKFTVPCSCACCLHVAEEGRRRLSQSKTAIFLCFLLPPRQVRFRGWFEPITSRLRWPIYVRGETSRFDVKQLIACVANIVAQTLTCIETERCPIETARCPVKQLCLHVQRPGSTHTEWPPLRVQHNQIRRHKNQNMAKRTGRSTN